MTEDDSDGIQYTYRTGFYQKLKQLNNDICIFHEQAKGVRLNTVKASNDIKVKQFHDQKILQK